MAAIVADKILAMHGGLSPELASLDQIAKIERPTEVPEDGLLCDLLWSDPDPAIMGWGYNLRGKSTSKLGPENCVVARLREPCRRPGG